MAAVLLAVLGVAMADVPWIAKLALGVGVLLYALRVYEREVMQGGSSCILSLSSVGDGCWRLVTPQGAYVARMAASVVVTPYCSILNFKAEGGLRLGCMIFPDSLPPGQYRQFLTKF